MTKPLSWNEIRARLDQFVHDYADATQENAESQSFWNDLLACYGVSRRRVATFEKRAKRASTGTDGRIDVFWPRVFIGEHKSAGQLDKATDQAYDYLMGGDIQDAEQPRYIVTSDFAHLRVIDLETDGEPEPVTIELAELPARAELLGFLGGYTQRTYSTEEQEAASQQAAKLMANLYAALSDDADNEPDDDETAEVSMLLTRLLFLMFGDDAGLWDRGLFHDFIETRTQEDGSDVGPQLIALFDILNTPESKRSSRADAAMLAFPYVNGALFADSAGMPYFDATMRSALLDACRFDWTAISPAVFGSLFQSIKSKEARREGGEHYTTEVNILKTIEPLFLDELRARVAKHWNQPKRLRELRTEMGRMQFLDPACGCGNFLVVAYREMRRIELDILVRLGELEARPGYAIQDQMMDVTWGLAVTLDQFHGIELHWWPAKIAETAMFLVDHQANLEMAARLGTRPNRLPIDISAHIHHGNALTTDWTDLLPATNKTYVFGNPPFIGARLLDAERATELATAWGGSSARELDYATGWYAKSLEFFDSTAGSWAFVTTNSITQGDQAARVFAPVFEAGWRIKFAHRTFAWSSEAPGRAAVHCVIVGFSATATTPRLFDYANPKAAPHEVAASNINAYLVDGPDFLVRERPYPLSASLTTSGYGSMPNDGGHLLVDSAARTEIIADPVAAKYLRPFVGARELLQGRERWCLWLTDLDPADLAASPILRERIAAVKQHREDSKRSTTVQLANRPHLFGEIRQPNSTYLCLPRHVSETRRYFTAATFDDSVICGDANCAVLDPDGLQFAIVSSSMFITWQRSIGGTLESRLRFSSNIVWNNLPLPALDDATRAKIIKAGQGVLDARSLHPNRSLADHYNPLAMDPALVRAHDELDAVVDRAFGASRKCTSERERQEILFARYQELTGA